MTDDPSSEAWTASARLRRLATIASVAVASTLVAAKLSAWLITGSVIILATLLDSVVDLAASLVIMYSVHHAQRPPDRAHRFGHGKAEPLGALAQAGFVAGSALVVVFQALSRLIEPQPLRTTELGVAVLVLAIVLTLALVLFQRHVTRTTGSVAIAADSLHYRGDLLMNLGAIGALVAATATDASWIDPATGIAIAAYLLVSAAAIGRSALNMLMDRELPREDRERIRLIVLDQPGVSGLHDLRTRSSGTTAFIELHLELDGDMSLRHAHDIADTVEAALADAFPGAEVMLHQEPAGLDDDRLDRRIAAGRAGAPPAS
ncbi:MAG: cation diffusion facilitator family transporter [Inquilinaceae bacterium]